MNGQKDILVNFKNHANDLWHERNWANTWFVLFEEVGGWKLEIKPRVWGKPWPHWCINYALICFFSAINACILRINSFVQSSESLICKLRSKRRVSSDHDQKENWRTTKLFLKHVSETPFREKKKKTFFRRKVERTALSESST